MKSNTFTVSWHLLTTNITPYLHHETNIGGYDAINTEYLEFFCGCDVVITECEKLYAHHQPIRNKPNCKYE